MRVTPRRKMLETVAAAVYNPVKILLLTNGELCKEHFLETKVLQMADPRYILFYEQARTFGEYRRQIKDLKSSSITYSRMRAAN